MSLILIMTGRSSGENSTRAVVEAMRSSSDLVSAAQPSRRVAWSFSMGNRPSWELSTAARSREFSSGMNWKRVWWMWAMRASCPVFTSEEWSAARRMSVGRSFVVKFSSSWRYPRTFMPFMVFWVQSFSTSRPWMA